MIVDVTGSILTPRIVERNREVEKKASAHGIPNSPTAMVGLAGFKMAVVQAIRFFRPDLYPASSLDEAKEWLLDQDIDT